MLQSWVCCLHNPRPLLATLPYYDLCAIKQDALHMHSVTCLQICEYRHRW